MNSPEKRGETEVRTIPELLLSPWFFLFLAVAVGFLVAQVVLGTLPPRWVKALVGALFLFGLFRLPLYGVVSLFLIAFPFPTFIFLGNSNVIFVLFILVAWAVKVRLGQEPVPPRSYLDWACWAYIGVHVLSFVNVDTKSNFVSGFYQLQFLSAAVGFYFILAKVLRTERQLRIALQAFAVTSLLVAVTGIMEYFLPRLVLIPDWFIAAGPTGKRFAEGGRVGGVFRFHGLLADFCAILFLLQAYLFIRSRSILARGFYLLLMAMGVFLIFVTANRGGFIIWGIGLLYLFLWIGRGALTMRRVIIGLPILLAAGVLAEIVTSRYGRIITLFWRLGTTQFERGVPENRLLVWSSVLREIPNHLWIGHGPFYDLKGGIAFGRWWPHNAYLMYLWTTGVIGLAIFLWILFKSVRKSYPGSNLSLGRVSFAHGATAILHVQIVQFALAQIRDEHQRGNVYIYLMWILFGAAAAARRIWKRGGGEAP